ncbi:lysozyme-like domain-containing protein [Histoplasma ohiense]|nr:lysozyme-like domain-containing protein [Histoplasma ohiense (nom. inval.)]
MHFLSLLVLQLLATSLTAAKPIKTRSESPSCTEDPNGYLTPSCTPSLPPDQTTPAGPACYKGTQFPPAEEWLTFNQLWALNSPVMSKFNSESEMGYIKKYIGEAAAAAGIDKGIFLTIMMQESNGNVRTVAGDGVTPGLMQALGSPSCLGTSFGECPESKIQGMIYAGALGTGQTEGLSACFTKNRRQYGAMLRCYNSGSIVDPLNWDVVKYGTPSYVSDIANRLRGLEPRRDCGFGGGIPSPGH